MRLRITFIIICLMFFQGCVNTKFIHLKNERLRIKHCDQTTLEYNTILPDHPLTLAEVIEIAICNNLDLRVKQREYAIQHEKATGERLKTLPSLTYSAEHSYRNENTASYSIDASTGQQTSSIDPVTGQVLPPAASIGSEQIVNRDDLTLAYNLVDFGLSYLRARQEINRAVSISFQYERQRQNLILDVFRAYWKTIAAQKGLSQSRKILDHSRILQTSIEKQVVARLIPNISGWKSELQLVNIRNRLTPMEKRYNEGKTELGALMGLPPHIDYELADVVIDRTDLEIDDIEVLENNALLHRPELFASDAEHHIYRDEVRAALVEMFPNTSLFTGRYYDGDTFLVHHYWTLSGVRTAWNLLSLPQKWYGRQEAKQRVKLSYQSRLALSLGVMAQVHLAAFSYQDAKERYENLDQAFSLNSQMLMVANREREYGALNGIDMINFDADTIEAQFNALQAYGEMQIAIELLNNAMGMPLHYQKLPKTHDTCTCDLVVKTD